MVSGKKIINYCKIRVLCNRVEPQAGACPERIQRLLQNENGFRKTDRVIYYRRTRDQKIQ